MRDRSAWRRILSAATDNRLSLAYLAVCAALLIWTVGDALFANDEGPSFAGVWPIFATLPTSLVVVLLAGGLGFVVPSELAIPVFVILLAAAALINAAVLGKLLRLVRSRRSDQ